MPVDVLVVEDERELATVYEEWLSEGYETAVAHDGDEALELLDDEVDVVLLDRRLPGRSGGDVLGAIRDRSLTCQVAMVTAVEPDFDVLDMDFDDYLVKPVDPEDLRATVERLLRRAAYDEQVREHVALVSKRAVLESVKSPAELAASDEYARLQREITDSRGHLDELLSELEGEDVEAVKRDLSPPADLDRDGGRG